MLWAADLAIVRRAPDHGRGLLRSLFTWVATSATLFEMARKSPTTTGIKLDGRMRARLKALSRLKQRSQHWLMKEAIERYLEQEEDTERLKRETLERWERYEATGEHISDRAIRAWLEGWGTEEEVQCPSLGA